MSREKQTEKVSKERQEYLKFKPFADDLRKAESWCELDGVLNRYQTVKNLSKMGYRKQSENAIEFPCKVGDKAWLVFTPRYPANPSDKGKWFMVEDGVQRLIYGAKGVSIETWNMGTISAREIGKKLFFTKEEAEKVLAKMKGGAE